MKILLFVPLVVALVMPNFSLAANFTLGDVYKSDKDETGLDISLRLPKDWELYTANSNGGAVYFADKSYVGIPTTIIKVEREVDNNNQEWQQFLANIKTKKNKQNYFYEQVGTRKGYYTENSSAAEYERQYFFSVKDAVYAVTFRTETNDSSPKEVKKYVIMLNAVIKSLKVPEKNVRVETVSRTKVSVSKDMLNELEKARRKGVEASVKGSVNSARAQAELYYSAGSNSYKGVCTSGQGNLGGIESLLIQAEKVELGTSNAPYHPAAAGVWNKALCHDSDQSYVAAAPLPGSTKKKPLWWCVDSTGYAGLVTKALTKNALSCFK